MRILLLAQFYPPMIGGEEQHVRTLGHALAARGHRVAVATLRHEGLAAMEMDGAVRVYRLRSTVARASWLFRYTQRRFALPVPDPELTLGLRRIVAHERPDVVHAHNGLVNSLLPRKGSRVPLVVTLQDYYCVCPTATPMRDCLPCLCPQPGRSLARAAGHDGRLKGATTTIGHALLRPWGRAAADMYLPVSQAVANGTGLPASGLPYHVVPRFIPDEIARPGDEDNTIARYVARLPRGEFVLFAGVFARLEGIEVLLRAYAGLPDVPPLVLIGNVKSEAPLPLPLPPNVYLLEDWPRQAVMAAWRRCLFGVMPSLVAEPCPTVSLEAMACGRPVVGSAVGGLLDQVISGETGYLVPPGDVDALRAAMWDLLAHPDERARMGAAAARRVRAFQASAVVPRIERIYASLIRAREADLARAC